MRNLLITMSGGTTSVINATLAGIVTAAKESSIVDRVYAGFPGLLGAMSGEFIDLTDCSPETLQVIKDSPGSASIGTTRTKIYSDEELREIEDIFLSHGIKYFINIGGNGTIQQTKSIASFCKNISVCAAPKTVDNDLGDEEFEKMWYTPGFPSCVNYWFHKTHMLNNENAGSFSHDKVLIAQTFGRETGFIVGAMRLADPERKTPLLLLLPEDQKSSTEVVEKIRKTVSVHGRAVIGISEGYEVGEYGFVKDLSGQRMYGSSKSTAAQELVNLCVESGIQARSYVPTIDQRQNFEHTLESDISSAFNIGTEIIRNFEKGLTHFFQTKTRNGTETIPLKNINNFTRYMKKEWIDYGNYDVTDEYVSYLKEFTNLTTVRKLYVGGIVR